jgi:hypothetical protein
VVVFSPYIDVLERIQELAPGLLITGNIATKERDALMRAFRDPKAGHRVMYSTTGVGGVGLDMSVANRVIVVDASWNPAVDLQAIARAWRMGQKKQTFVYRLIAHGTLEERILRMQVQKTSLAMRVMEENEITRFYSKENLKSLDETMEELTLSPEAVRTVDAALANVMTADNDLVVSSHDHMFLDDEVELSEEEKARAMNEMVLALYDGFTLRTVSTSDGTTQSINTAHNFFAPPYDDELVPPLKPMAVKLMVSENEMASVGKDRVPYKPEVRFQGVPCYVWLGPAFATNKYDVQVYYRTKRRWEFLKKFRAFCDPKTGKHDVAKLPYKLTHKNGKHLEPGEYVFKARFVSVDKTKMSAWSEESETVIIG